MKYERIKYPDGQISAKITELGSPPYEIRERINTYEDLIFIRSLAQILDDHGVKEKYLYISCLLGQRSDRKFDEYQSFDLRVITELINSCKFTEVGVLRPHSPVTLALLDHSKELSDIGPVGTTINSLGVSELCLISPDAGAYSRVALLAEMYTSHNNLRHVPCFKKREGSTITTVVSGDVKGKRCLIVDDLCDAGGTFISCAKALKEAGAKVVYLYVTHGLFTKGLDVLKPYIDHIYCTDSYREINDPYITQYKAPQFK